MSLAKIKIEGSGFPGKTRVFLNEIDISSHIVLVNVVMAANSVPKVVIEMLAEVEFTKDLVTASRGIIEALDVA